jgi:hypothetical protein
VIGEQRKLHARAATRRALAIGFRQLLANGPLRERVCARLGAIVPRG